MSPYNKNLFISCIIITSAIAVALPLMLSAATIDEPGKSGSKLPIIGIGDEDLAPPDISKGNIVSLVRYIYVFGMAAAGLAAMGGLIYGGVLYLIAGGSQTKTTKGKDRIRGSLMGLGLVLVSFIILYTINPALVNLSEPYTDPLDLVQPTSWNRSQYGLGKANASLGTPCASPHDCAYNLACCRDGEEFCGQFLAFLNIPKNESLFSLLNSLSINFASAQEIKWFQCGVEAYEWVKQDHCPNKWPSTSACPVPQTTPSKTDCCNPDEKPSGPAACCGVPRLVTATNQTECQTNNADLGCNCTGPLDTCRNIIVDDSGFVWTVGPKKHIKDDLYGQQCRNKPLHMVGDPGFDHSCLDNRLVCSYLHDRCLPPGTINSPCEKDKDCCHDEFMDINPDCQKLKERLPDTTKLKCKKYKGQKSQTEYCQIPSGDEVPEKPRHLYCTVLDGKPSTPCKELKLRLKEDYPIEPDSNTWCRLSYHINDEGELRFPDKTRCCCRDRCKKFPKSQVSQCSDAANQFADKPESHYIEESDLWQLDCHGMDTDEELCCCLDGEPR